MQRITEGVKNLIIINVILFFAKATLSGQSNGLHVFFRKLALFFPESQHFEPYQLVTHFFMHADRSHLAFNMLALFFLGPMVESRLGLKQFLILYFSSALGAFILHLGFDYYQFYTSPETFRVIPMLGASGAIFGVVAAFGALFPEARLMLLFPPIPVKGKYLAIIAIGMGVAMGVMAPEGQSVAHLAHVGGAIIGYLYIRFFVK